MKQNLCCLSSKIDRNFEKGYFIGDDKDDDDDADDDNDDDDDDDGDDDDDDDDEHHASWLVEVVTYLGTKTVPVNIHQMTAWEG